MIFKIIHAMPFAIERQRVVVMMRMMGVENVGKM
jgi:hypothetical protein